MFFCAVDVTISSYVLYGVNVMKAIIVAFFFFCGVFLALGLAAICSKGAPRSLSVSGTDNRV